MAVNVQVLDENDRPVFASVAAIRTSDQTILNLYTTDSEGVARIIESGTWYPRVMVSRNYKSRLKMIILNDQDSMNADYVVDAAGGGTHLTLHGTTGALAAAIATGVSKFIWVCASHTESVSTTQTLTSLGTTQKITVASGGRGRGVITYSHNTAAMIITTPSGGSNSLLRFQDIRLVRNTGNTGIFIQATGGPTLPKIEFDGVDWGETTGAHTYLIDVGSVGSAAYGGVLMQNCIGKASALTNTSAGANATAPVQVLANTMSMAVLFARGGSSNAESGTAYEVLDNDLNLDPISGFESTLSYLLRLTHSTTVPVTIKGNELRYSGVSDFIDLGTLGTTDLRDITITGNNFVASAVGARFCDISPNSGTSFTNIVIMGNALHGPGSGTAINVSPTLVDSVILNGYYNWTTNVGGAGASSAFNGSHGSLTGLTTGDDHTQYVKLTGRATGQTVQGGTASSESLSLESTANATKGLIKMLDGVVAQRYLRVGALTTPLSITDGDITALRFNLGNVAFGQGGEAALRASLNGSDSNNAGGPDVFAGFYPTISPSGDSAIEYRTLNFLAAVPSGNTRNFSVALEGIFVEAVRPRGSGNYTRTAYPGGAMGLRATGARIDSLADDAGTVSKSVGIGVTGYDRPSGAFVTKAITEAVALWMPNPDSLGGLGLTNYYMLDIEQPTRANTINVGIRQAGRYVMKPPTATNITSVATTIPSDAECIRITANASYTLTNTPSIANGQLDGQRLYIYNEDTTDAITIQDDSTLSGSNVKSFTGEDIIIGPREVHQFIWNEANSEWGAVDYQREKEVTISVLLPVLGDNIVIRRFKYPVQILEMAGIVKGNSSPSVTVNPVHGTDRSAAGTNLFSSPQQINSTTTGDIDTSGFNDATIDAGAFFRLTTVSLSGSVDELSVTFRYFRN